MVMRIIMQYILIELLLFDTDEWNVLNILEPTRGLRWKALEKEEIRKTRYRSTCRNLNDHNFSSSEEYVGRRGEKILDM